MANKDPQKSPGAAPPPKSVTGSDSNWIKTSDALRFTGFWEKPSLMSKSNETKLMNDQPKSNTDRLLTEINRQKEAEDPMASRNEFSSCKKCGLSGHLTSQCTNFILGTGIVKRDPTKTKPIQDNTKRSPVKRYSRPYSKG